MSTPSNESRTDNSSSLIMKLAMSPFRFKLYLLKNLPMALLTGLKIHHLDKKQSDVSVSLSYLTKNPFNSIYFACLAMAAELSTGMLAMDAIQQSGHKFSMLVVGMEAEFHKKATGKIIFNCEDGIRMKQTIQQCLNTGEPATLTAKSIGINEADKTVAEFSFTWSFKPKD